MAQIEGDTFIGSSLTPILEILIERKKLHFQSISGFRKACSVLGFALAIHGCGY